jgi:hypothetical protein
MDGKCGKREETEIENGSEGERDIERRCMYVILMRTAGAVVGGINNMRTGAQRPVDGEPCTRPCDAKSRSSTILYVCVCLYVFVCVRVCVCVCVVCWTGRIDQAWFFDSSDGSRRISFTSGAD